MSVAARHIAKTRRPESKRTPQPLRTKTTSSISNLQRAVGNRGMHGLLNSNAIQPKLTVIHSGDQYEREADRVADQVMRMPEPQPGLQIQRSPLNIQRQCMKCEEELKRQPLPDEAEEVVQRKPADKVAASGVSGGVESYLNTARGAGQPLPDTARTYFEPRFGRDFGKVRVHTDNRAAHAAAQIRARAFTSGDDIIFGARQYAPGTTEGRQLLAHELTHVMQQSNVEPHGSRVPGDLQRKIDGEHDLRSPRFAGDEELEAAFDDEKHIKQGSTGPAVGKLQQALIDAGFPLPISTRKTGKPDEIFGPETKAGVAAFQKDAGLTGSDIDGIVGPITMGLFDLRFPPGPKPPEQKPVRPATRKKVTVNITRTHGSTKVVDRSLAFANTIYIHQANLEVVRGSEVTLTEAQSKALIGDDLILEEHFFDKVLSDEEKKLYDVNKSPGAVRGCFVKQLSENNGLSIRPSMGVGFVGFAVGNPASDKTFAHELGHALGIENHGDDPNLLMAPGATGTRLSQKDIDTVRASSLAK